MITINREINTFRWVIIGLITVSASFFAGRYSNPTKEIVRIQTVEVEVERKERDVEVVRTETKVEKPDGTRVTQTETREVERTREESVSTKDKSNEHIREFGRAQWSVGLYSTLDQKVAVTVDRRVFGNVFAGVYGSVDPYNRRDYALGVGLRFEF
jgi:hypothetical protein